MRAQPALEACLARLPVRPFLRQCALDVCRCEAWRRARAEERRLAQPCFCAPLRDFLGQCAALGLLTLGTLPHSSDRISFHPKCAPFLLS